MTTPFTPYADLLERPVLVPLRADRVPRGAPRCTGCGKAFLPDRRYVCQDCERDVAIRAAAEYLRRLGLMS